jgi:cation diffusion facilitator family transporter
MFATIRDWLGFGAHFDGHSHSHDGAGGHGHTHGVVDASLTTTDKGIWAIKWSFIILAITAGLQLIVVIVSNSVALLADTIHNTADATTAIPLWVAFVLARRKPSDTFTYGFGRVEDFAGILIVLIILFSALVAGYEAIDRLIHPHSVTALRWLAAAGVIGFLGNEAVAVFRIRVGRQMNSAALIADGYHARTDGLTSLAVVLGALGVWLGFPLADPIIGLLITVAIMGIVWQSARAVLTRSLDGVEPNVTAKIRHAAEHVPGIARVVTAKARWIGHRLHADIGIAADDTIPLSAATAIARNLKHEVIEHLPALRTVNIMFQSADGEDASQGASHHPAPEPFRFKSELAEGVVEIVNTPKGERMRMTVTRRVPGLHALITIERPDKTETLSLMRTSDHIFESAEAPAEPHEFTAQLRLTTGGQPKVIPFRMEEPE